MSVTKEEIVSFLASQKEPFREQFQVTKIALFGSYATGSANADSDIDVIVEFEPETTGLVDKKEKIRTLIKNRFHKEVDLCREKYIKPYFRDQILSVAIYV